MGINPRKNIHRHRQRGGAEGEAEPGLGESGGFNNYYNYYTTYENDRDILFLLWQTIACGFCCLFLLIYFNSRYMVDAGGLEHDLSYIKQALTYLSGK